MTHNTGFPRHALNRIAVLHFINGLIHSFESPVRMGLSEEEKLKCGECVSALRFAINQGLFLEGVPKDRKDLGRAQRAIGALSDAVYACWPQDEFDAREAVVAAMLLVARGEEALPVDSAKRAGWGVIHQLIMNWMLALDPELEGKPIDVGTLIGEKLQGVLHGLGRV